MIPRRQFLHTSIVFLLVPVACATSEDDGATTSASPTLPACDGIGSTSSKTMDHTHDVCVPLRDLEAPPSGGASYETSTSAGHTHAVALRADQLLALARSDTVQITTTFTSGHVHVFALVRAT